MKTLVIPDVHQDWPFVQRALEVPHDRLVFLGDYLDTHVPAHSGRAVETVEGLLSIVQTDSDVTALYGNHDLQYLWPDNHSVRCSGLSRQRLVDTAPFVGALREHLQWFTVVDDWLLTHAGLHPSLVDPGAESFPTMPLLLRALDEAEGELAAGRTHAIIGPGRARGGPYAVGGIVWCDWNSEFKHCTGLHQIVGHTASFAPPRHRRAPESSFDNICIDCAQTYVVVIEDGHVTEHQVAA